MTANGYGVSFWDDENVLNLTVVVISQLCEYTKIIHLYTLKWVNCMVYELYLNKAVIFFKKEKPTQLLFGFWLSY